ncbi:MAG: hypothetical protein DMG65_16520 [Candidatus Angelobacter sp. Gp1-AA117]|nr:MAG: hypothetical protein DMG65_16520 [Candidatus Angelobacter sp. Gp1-AA117]
MKKTFLALLLTFYCLGGRDASAQSLISVSPASLSLKGRAGQTSTQNFKVSNLTDSVYVFKVEVTDVLVENGKRTFITAGQTSGSIAALAVVPVNHVELQPGQATVVPVIFVLPVETDIRAVAVFFRGQPAQSPQGPRVQLNLGTVVDFSTSDNVKLDIVTPQVAPPTATTNTTVTQELANIGPEPVIVRGVAAIVNQPGKLVGRAVFEQKRLLPGERNSLHANYAGTLPPGKYRVLCSLEYAGKAVTRTTEFSVP